MSTTPARQAASGDHRAVAAALPALMSRQMVCRPVVPAVSHGLADARPAPSAAIVSVNLNMA
jgi:hypothetical protein